MTRTLLKIVTLSIFISCSDANNSEEFEYTGFIEKKLSLVGYDKQINLIDSLGTISIKIPARLDTFYSWHNTSDCLPCGWLQYRFSDKSYSQFAESGFYWTFVPDSTYQLNIGHKPVREFPDTIVMKPLSEKDTSFCYYHPRLVSDSDTANFLFKEFKVINGMPFVLSAFVVSHGYLTNSQTLFVIAETTLKSRELYFVGECGAKDTTDFLNNMYKSFLSIKIKEKQ